MSIGRLDRIAGYRHHQAQSMRLLQRRILRENERLQLIGWRKAVCKKCAKAE